MQSKFYLRLRSSLLLSAGLSLGLATLMPRVEARIATNGIYTNGITLKATQLQSDAGSTSRLQLEGRQLVLQASRSPGGPNCLERPCPPPTN